MCPLCEVSRRYRIIIVQRMTQLFMSHSFSPNVFCVCLTLCSVASVCQVLELSDHLPVEVKLKSSAHLLQATPLLILISVSVIVCSFLSAL